MLGGGVLALVGVGMFGAGIVALTDIGIDGHPSAIALLLMGAFLGAGGVFLVIQGRRIFREIEDAAEKSRK